MGWDGVGWGGKDGKEERKDEGSEGLIFLGGRNSSNCVFENNLCLDQTVYVCACAQDKVRSSFAA